MPADSPQIVDVSPAIFRFGDILSTTFSAWTGLVTLKEADKEINGSRNMDEEFFKPSSIMLVPPAALKPFGNRTSQMNKFISNTGIASPIPHLRFVRKTDLQEVQRACQQCKDDFTALADVFVNQYPELRERRIDLFNSKHPEFMGRLDNYFPSVTELHLKFDFKWQFMRLQEPEALDAIMVEEQERFRENTRNWLLDVARDVRKSAVDAALAFRQGMDRAQTKVDSRSVARFRDFLQRFENQDFMGDAKLRDVISSMKERVFSMDQWLVEDQSAMNEIRGYLDQVVAIGSDEGEVTEVARNFVRAETGVDVDYAAIAQQRSFSRVGLVSEVDEADAELASAPTVIQREILQTDVSHSVPAETQ